MQAPRSESKQVEPVEGSHALGFAALGVVACPLGLLFAGINAPLLSLALPLMTLAVGLLFHLTVDRLMLGLDGSREASHALAAARQFRAPFLALTLLYYSLAVVAANEATGAYFSGYSPAPKFIVWTYIIVGGVYALRVLRMTRH